MKKGEKTSLPKKRENVKCERTPNCELIPTFRVASFASFHGDDDDKQHSSVTVFRGLIEVRWPLAPVEASRDCLVFPVLLVGVRVYVCWGLTFPAKGVLLFQNREEIWLLLHQPEPQIRSQSL